MQAIARGRLFQQLGAPVQKSTKLQNYKQAKKSQRSRRARTAIYASKMESNRLKYGIDLEEACERQGRNGERMEKWAAGVVKFTHAKKTRSSKLTIVRPGFAETIYFSCFSSSSMKKYKEFVNEEKKTVVRASSNPLVGEALYADEDIEEGEMICLYHGVRMCKAEGKARVNGEYDDRYLLNITRGVYVDGKDVGYGAAMANHSCNPNSELQHDYLPGYDRAPVGLLRALRKISKGQPIECDYGYFDRGEEALPDLEDIEAYEPCFCGQDNCCGIFRIKDSS